MRAGRRVSAPVVVVVLLAGSLLALIPGPAHAAGLSDRKCADPIISGDGVRYMSVCTRGWTADDYLHVRGVVEIHTYAWIGGGTQKWVDSRSQSITLESALISADGYQVAAWGQQKTGPCRVNGPGGSVGCSVPNTIRVAFYSQAISALGGEHTFDNTVYYVSWRDDRGIAHPNNPICNPDTPYCNGFLSSPPWYA
jgi:hypothetical protein